MKLKSNFKENIIVDKFMMKKMMGIKVIIYRSEEVAVKQ